MTTRRGFLQGILAAGVAPFVVKAGSLMATRVPETTLILPYQEEFVAFIHPSAYDDLLDLRFEARKNLANWMADRIDRTVYETLTGTVHGNRIPHPF